jgi:hypothetical protein
LRDLISTPDKCKRRFSGRIGLTNKKCQTVLPNSRHLFINTDEINVASSNPVEELDRELSPTHLVWESDGNITSDDEIKVGDIIHINDGKVELNNGITYFG